MKRTTKFCHNMHCFHFKECEDKTTSVSAGSSSSWQSELPLQPLLGSFRKPSELETRDLNAQIRQSHSGNDNNQKIIKNMKIVDLPYFT